MRLDINLPACVDVKIGGQVGGWLARPPATRSVAVMLIFRSLLRTALRAADCVPREGATLLRHS